MIRRGARRRITHADPAGSSELVVSDGGTGVHLVHTGRRPLARLTELAEWLGPPGPEQLTVLVGTVLGDGGGDALCERLAPILDESVEAGVRVVRLVMSAGADEEGGQHSVARRICSYWGVDVFATAGAAVVVPDGTLFSPELPDAPGGWWHFSAGVVPQRVGTRLPVPDWESALERLDRDVAPGYVVEPVPAGLVVQSADAPATGVDALCYAVPPDPRRPLVLVGAPGTPPVPPDALADVVAALPGPVRRSLRLLSPDGRDVLAAGQAVADLLGTEIEVANGVPLIMDGATPDGAATTPWLIGADGVPSWRPYVQAVTCLPARDGQRPAPRTEVCRAPMAGLSDGDGPGVWLLDRRWQVTATPSGLWIGQRGNQPPPDVAARPADPDVAAVDLGLPGRALDQSFWPVLDSLFEAMDADVRSRAMVHVHGVLGTTGGDSLRRLAVRHEFSLMPQRAQSAPDAAAHLPSHPPAATTGHATEWDTGETRETTESQAGAAASWTEAPDPARPLSTMTSSGGGAAGTGPRPAWQPSAMNTAPLQPVPWTLPSPAASVQAPAATADSGIPAAAHGPERVAAEPRVTAPTGDDGSGWENGPVRAENSAHTAPTAPPDTFATGWDANTPSSAHIAHHTGRDDIANRTGEALPPHGPDPAATPSAGGLGPHPSPSPSPASGTERTEQTPGTPGGTDPAPHTPVSPAPDWFAPVTQRATASSWTEAGAGTGDDEASGGSGTGAETGMGAGTGAGAAFGDRTTAGAEPAGGHPRTVPAAEVRPENTPSLSPCDPSAQPQATRRGGREPDPAAGTPVVSTTGGTLLGAADLPVLPSHRSTPADRDTLRTCLGDMWDRHSTSVSRTLTRMPGLRTGEEFAASSADLAAVHAYLTEPADGRLRAWLAGADNEALSFLRCLASGLRRLPSYRAAALHTGGMLGALLAADATAGRDLGDAMPVLARAVDRTQALPAAGHCLIWSATGRRTGALADSDALGGPNHVLFAPGTRFRVLEVREQGGAATVALLRELPEHAPADDSGRLTDADVAALERLHALEAAATADGQEHTPNSGASDGTYPATPSGALP
ncbi:hypothetical protein [Streptomyces sp. NPDC007856]|uniref:hypothetical protein n=1 Tax=Streptomyces sp. NPDC007856 TaxID=3364781 RepID=UPI0036B2E734